ncbi:TatD family nuclease-associated radical SAM protein [uncultured Methanolobus sp.]|uniref:TatD family nuclease-associated radical SAM protein n=1 Tax=uncultured Methanolobus sp. TaxID=218300 RepID=UPI0029C71276|nr:TatD family nuclease-associated radical SAM protein [uncultured Methanolobus sp.]
MPDTDNSIPMLKDTICYEAYGNLYLNITNQCSASCIFCIRDICDGVYGYNLRLSREPSEEEIIKELESHDLTKYHEIVFTGFGEPTCRFDTVLHITSWLHKKGSHVRLDTNGHAALMNPGRDVVTELKEAGLDAVSVSLNAESEEKYNQLCKPAFEGSYQALLDFTKKAVDAGIKTRMTVVSQQDIDTNECEIIATELGASFRIR